MAYKQEKNHQFEVAYLVDSDNKRIRVDEVTGEITKALSLLEDEARKLNIEKLIVYTEQDAFFTLLQLGYQLEAVIDYFFHGETAYVFTKYYSQSRITSDFWIKEDDILQSVYTKQPEIMKALPENYHLRTASLTDTEALAALYQRIFTVYPTPMHDPNYIAKQMNKDTIFSVLTYNGKIISAASAEINRKMNNAELTDCATLPEFRKSGFIKILLRDLENKLVQQGIICAYSIARSLSFGMNAAFFQLGYAYRGRLTKNCLIFDKWEDMNVWIKKLTDGGK
ncbi:putative beta-lysine N-acetyltransferase [Caldibacillus lycopersici]|uniref:Beta-lysine N-acetyltransferase n=1 Tax=Perspicuibacillus lycopersici TaxID=1325689 RepID=A0AAE3ISE9_9BACI|nr:putative beta-lysine N-acetyltransferase [Perspicuibacillus lycopersici]MCU9613621.1 putative beta-lysine N-acetyltransferase [Perspicuibacillus lycopersici]